MGPEGQGTSSQRPLGWSAPPRVQVGAVGRPELSTLGWSNPAAVGVSAAERHSSHLRSVLPLSQQTNETTTGFRLRVLRDEHGNSEMRSQPLPPKKARTLGPEDLQDSFVEFTGRAPDSLAASYDIDSDMPPDAFDDIHGPSEPVIMDEPTPYQGKRYRSSDHPMADWEEIREMYLMESMRRSALGSLTARPHCMSCKSPYDKDVPPLAGSAPSSSSTGCCRGCGLDDPLSTRPVHPIPPTSILVRCLSCGEFFECAACSIKRHQQHPTHFLEKWNGEFFERTTLTELGLVFQLGHYGFPCRNPGAIRKMTVLDITGVHTVTAQFCACSASAGIEDWQQLYRTGWYPATPKVPASCVTLEALNTYRHLKVGATVNVRDMVNVMEDLTDPLRTERIVDRYKVLGRTSRQYSGTTRIRRAGIAYLVGGLSAAPPRSVAVECIQCPREGVNVPDNAYTLDKTQWFLFMRILSMDANFRLKCRMRAQAHQDPPLYDGLGVHVPGHMYDSWCAMKADEQPVSDCVPFAAIDQKNTRFDIGLRYTGVVGVSCRHEVLLSVGNLKKGERYASSDFVLFWLIGLIYIRLLYITYDIACQYSVNIEKREAELPGGLFPTSHRPVKYFALPVWHGNCHKLKCEATHSLRFKWGVGKTDGEGPERIWSQLNSMSYMTREEQPGAREDDHEDKINQMSFKKNISSGLSLYRKIKIAIEEFERQDASFSIITDATTPAQRQAWMKMIDDWETGVSKECPYLSEHTDSVSEKDVRNFLRSEEAKEAADTTTEAATNGSYVSATGFLILGLDLEESQRRLARDIARTPQPTATQQGHFLDRRSRVKTRIRAFRRHQDRYMPNVAAILARREEASRASNAPPVLAEHEPLLLPSLTSPSDASAFIRRGELRLREGQLGDDLDDLRTRLLAQRYFVNYRNAHVSGQKGSTRAAKLLDDISARIKDTVARYHVHRTAYLALLGGDEDAALPFRPLTLDEIGLYNIEENDKDASIELNVGQRRGSRTTGHTRGHRGNHEPGESRRTAHWLWFGKGVPNEADDMVTHHCVRLEYSKAYARRQRWWEELELVKEEMRRVLRTLNWERGVWQKRVDSITEEDEALAAGMRAYGRKQADNCVRLSTSFKELWLRTHASQGYAWTATDQKALEIIRVALGVGAVKGPVVSGSGELNTQSRTHIDNMRNSTAVTSGDYDLQQRPAVLDSSSTFTGTRLVNGGGID